MTPAHSLLRATLPLTMLILLLSACSALDAPLAATATPTTVFPQATPSISAPSSTEPLIVEDSALIRVYEEVSPSVVSVESRFIDPVSGSIETRRGSGFIFDRGGHIVTNAHLVKGAEAITVTLQNSWVIEAELRGADSFSDLAVLKIETAQERLKPLEMGESAALKVGQRAISIGSPFGLSNSMTIGIISGLGRSLRSAELIDGATMPGFDNPSIIQIDAPVHPGASGGPLLDAHGRAIGITTAIQSDNGLFQGVGFAVPADTARRVLPELIARGHVEYAWMGLLVMPEDGGYSLAGLSEALDLPVERGVLLKGVSLGSPAALAGLRGGDAYVDVRGLAVCAGGDIIVAINGRHINTLDDLNAYLIQNTRPGDDVELLVLRGQRTFTATLSLVARPTASPPARDCSTAE